MAHRLAKFDTIEAAPADSQPILTDLKSKGRFINFFKTMAASPSIMDGYIKFSQGVAKGSLSGKAREAIALLLADRNSCNYCMTAHTNAGKKEGFTDAEVAAARAGKLSGDDKSVAAATFAKAILDAKGGHVADADIAAAKAKGLNDGEIIEIIAVIALNTFTNYFNSVNDTEVDLPNPIKVH